jgi:geranylgeranylglycerol-phosphate geranylgeranyltransferase
MEELIANQIKNTGKFPHLVSLGRPWNGILLLLSYLFGGLIITNTINLPLILGGLSFLALYMAGTTLNDIFDFEEDKINMPYRPLQKEIISINEAYIFSIILYLIGILISYSLGSLILLIATIFIVLSFLYSVEPAKFVKRGILGNIVLGIVSIFLPAMAGIITIAGKIQTLEIILLLTLTIFFIGISLFKDFKDMEGDKGKRKTIAIKFGKQKTTLLGLIISTPFFIIFITTLIMIKQNLTYFLFIILLIPLTHLKLKNYPTKQEHKRFTHLRLLLLLFLIILILSIYLI